MKKIMWVLFILAIGLWPAHAQESVLSAVIDIDVNAVEITTKEYSDSDIRKATEKDKFGYTSFNIGPVGWDWLTDTVIALNYRTERYGGKIEVNKGGLGGFKVWVNIAPFLKLTTGTDIESTYADSLDADPKLRIYNGTTEQTWDASTNPDNITGSTGLLLETFWGPVTAAAAAQVNNIADMVFQIRENTNDTEGEVSEDRDYQYGARIGSRMGQWGTANASYIIQYKRTAKSFNYIRGEFGPLFADAEVYTHHFGLYASLTPVKDMGLTLGWASMYTKYRDEFLGGTKTIQTLTPVIIKNGLNVNARYKGIPGLTLRTDHNYSFWVDMNYTILGIPQTGNIGLISPASAASYADVIHSVLWNGAGASYAINDWVNLSLYVRNLHREDRAEDLVFTRNQFVVEPRVSWRLNNRLEMYGAFSWEYLIDTMSEELNKRMARSNYFIPGKSPVATRDTTMIIKIPLGLTLRI